MLEQYSALAHALSAIPHLVCVSVKANSNLSLLRLLASHGAGFDVVSAGELERVRLAGADAKKIVFSGVGKTDRELELALRQGVLMVNIESESELKRVARLAGECSVRAPVSLRINPDIDAKTHAYVSTGLNTHKFGIPSDVARALYREWKDCPTLEFVGVDCHVGSNLLELGVFEQLFSELRSFIKELKPLIPSLRYIDLGGGIGTSYGNETALDVGAYAALAQQNFSDLGVTIICEPGRFIFADCGVLLSQVVTVKVQGGKKFIILDAGFTDLLRPLLYGSYHHVEPLRFDNTREEEPVDLVGPVCESSDCFATGRVLPRLEEGEPVIVYSAGAYGFSMASHYNTRPKPPEVLIDGDAFRLIRSREQLGTVLHDELTLLRDDQ